MTDADADLEDMVPMMTQANGIKTATYQRTLSLILITGLVTIVLLLAILVVILNGNLASHGVTSATDSTSTPSSSAPPPPAAEVPLSIPASLVPTELAAVSSPTPTPVPITPTPTPPAIPTPLYDVSLMLMFVDEVRFLRVFIEYYLLIGVQHFYLYDHHEGGSQDGSFELLQSYISRGLVTYKITWVPDEGLVAAQRRTYASFWNEHRHETKWLVNVDADEYVVLKQHKTLSEFLAPFDPYGGVALNWLFFGTSGVEEIGQKRIMMEELTWAADAPNGWGKMIIQPTRTSLIDVHFSVFIEPYDPVWADQKVIPFPRGFSDPNTINQGLFLPLMTHVATDLIQLNHYFFRDEKFLREVKFARRKKNENEDMRVNLERNISCSVKQDLAIQPFMPLLRQRLEDQWWKSEQ